MTGITEQRFSSGISRALAGGNSLYSLVFRFIPVSPACLIEVKIRRIDEHLPSRQEPLALAHLHARIAILERLIADETNRYAGRKFWDRAPARPNNQVSIGRALAGIRIGMRWRSILLDRRFGFRNRASSVVFGAAASGPGKNRAKSDDSDR